MIKNKVIPPVYLFREPEEVDHDTLLITTSISGNIQILALKIRRTLKYQKGQQPDRACTYRVIRSPHSREDELKVDQAVKIKEDTILEPRGWSYPFLEVDKYGYQLIVDWENLVRLETSPQ